MGNSLVVEEDDELGELVVLSSKPDTPKPDAPVAAVFPSPARRARWLSIDTVRGAPTMDAAVFPVCG